MDTQYDTKFFFDMFNVDILPELVLLSTILIKFSQKLKWLTSFLNLLTFMFTYFLIILILNIFTWKSNYNIYSTVTNYFMNNKQ